MKGADLDRNHSLAGLRAVVPGVGDARPGAGRAVILVMRGLEDNIREVACVDAWDAAMAAARLLESGTDPSTWAADPLWFTIEPPYHAVDEDFAAGVLDWHEQHSLDTKKRGARPPWEIPMTSPDTFLPHLLLNHIAVVGMTGRGKTSTAKLVVEQGFRAGEHICIFDPIKSDWYGIISNSAGDGPGLPFTILGGPHGHVPLDADDGAKIAELVASGALPYTIIDTSQFKAGGLQRFWNDFAPVLFEKINVVLRLVLEEAHELAPKEKSGIGGENMGVYHAKKFATGGRSKGIRLLVCTQRVQSLHNALLGSCSTVMVHGMNLPADREPVTKWLNGSISDKAAREDIERSIPNLHVGEAWVCSILDGGFIERRQMPRIQTYDNSAAPTTHGRLSKKIVAAPIDLANLVKMLGAPIEEPLPAGEKALRTEVKKLRDTIGTLNAQLELVKNRASTVHISENALEQAKSAGYRDGHAKGLAEGRDQGRREIIGQLQKPLATFNEALQGIMSQVHLVPRPSPLQVEARAAVLSADLKADLRPHGYIARTTTISPSARAILDAIHSVFPRSMSFAAAARRAGISNRSSAYRGYAKTVASAVGHEIIGTSEGYKSLLRSPVKPAPGQSPVEAWADKLPPSAAAMLRTVSRAHPHSLSKEQIAEGAGVSATSSGLGSNLRELLDLELIIQNGKVYQLAEGMLRTDMDGS